MPTTVATLRDLMPIRPLTFAESLSIAELQASKFLALSGVTEAPFAEKHIADLPRLQIDRMSPAPVSGATQWSHGRWLIILNGSEPRTRQRFSLAHEFKHILDAPFDHVIYPALGEMTSGERAEQVCDYFAASLLIPRLLLKRAWVGGEQSTRALARRFDVSPAAISVRLRQTGLSQPGPRCEIGQVAA